MASRRLTLFVESITPDILPIDKYVDWGKIQAEVKSLETEIQLLKRLEYSKFKEKLPDLLLELPAVLEILRLLVAHTPDDVWFSDGRSIDFKAASTALKKGDRTTALTISDIFYDMGLPQFLKSVESINDIIRGVLIGLETHARKSRRGSLLELRIDSLIKTVLAKLSKHSQVNLECKKRIKINLKNGQKELDFLLISGDNPKIAVEVNFYSTGGSKPSEVLERAYPDLQHNLKESNIGFIVITDGKGWFKMKPALDRSLQNLTHCMTIKQAEEGQFEEAVLRILKGLES